MSEFTDMLQSTEGLSEDFKAQAPALFEAAVAAKVEEATKALQEEFDAKMSAALEEAAKVAAEKTAAALEEAAAAAVEHETAALEEQKAAFIAETERLTEAVATAQNELQEQKDEHADELFAIQEHIEEMAEAQSDSKMETLRENMDLYMDYVAREWVKEHRETIVDQQKVALAEEFISAIQGVMAAHGLAESDATAGLRARIDEQAEQLEDITEAMHELLAEKVALEEQLNDAERIMAMEEMTADMVATDKAKVAGLAKMIAEERDIDVFKEKLSAIVESVASEVVEEEAPAELAVTEGIVEEPKQEKQTIAESYDPISAMAASMRHMYR